MAITVTLMGVDITNKVNFRTLAITDTQEVTGDTLSIVMYGFDQDLYPRVGNEIIVQDGSTKEFAGILTDVERQIGEGNRLVIYECTAIDYTYMLDRRYINKVYGTKAVANGSSDSMIEDILYDLKTAAEGDDVTGIGDSFYNSFYSNLSPTYVMEGGPTVRQQVFQRILPSQAISTLAESTGNLWWIDFDKRINFRPVVDSFATFLPYIDGMPTIHVEGNITDFHSMRIEDSIQGLGTKAIIKDAIVKSTATITDELTITAALGNQAGGVKVSLSKRPFSELDIVSVIRSRGGVNTTFTLALEDIAREASNVSEPTPTTTAFVYVGRQGQNTAYVRFTTHGIQEYDILKITYNYSTNDDHENIDTTAVAKAASATGGDGYHEFVFSQGSEIAVTGLNEIDEIAQIMLDRKSTIMRRGSFTSFTKGWKAGQIFRVKWDHEYINEDVWAINVNKRILTPADDPNIEDNIIESTIQFANMPRGLRL